MGNHLAEITEYLWRQSWQLAVLIVAVAVVCSILRNRSAHVRYLLWLIVLAKCLVPPFLSVPLAVLPVEERAEPLARLPVAQPLAAFEVPDKVGNRSMAMPSISVERDTSQAKTSRFSMPSSHQVLGAVWIVGVVVFGCVAIAKAMRSNLRLRRQRSPLPDDLQVSVRDLLSGFGMRSHPKVWLLNGVGQPFVWGLLRGDIYLPDDYLRIDNAAHRRNILGHEVCHILRLDAAVNSLQVLAQAIFWFHPLVWWANQKTRMEREKCCDEMAVAHLGTRAKEYSAAIVKALVSEHESTRPVPSLAVAGLVKDVEERIRTMLRPGKKFYKHPSSVAATFVLLLALLTVPTALVLTARAETKPNAEAKEKSPTTAGPATAEGNAAATAALFRVIRRGNLERIRLALTQGADLEVKNKDGCTPLYAAVAKPGGNNAMVKLLLEAGANPNARDPRGQIPLHVAVRDCHISGVEQLVSAGSDVNARDKKGVSPAMIAFELGQTDMFDLMVAHGATVSTDLMSAYKGDLSGVQSLIENGKAQETFERGLTLLHAAAAGGHTAIVELLLTNGLDVHSETQARYTALHHAAAGNHREVAELLLAKGADVDAETAIDWSYTTPSYLLPDVHPEPANQTPLHWAIREGHKDMIEWLLARGANPNADGGDYHPLGSPLHWAVWFGNVDIAVLLVSHGGYIHLKSKNFSSTPLHEAVRHGSPTMAEALVTKTGDTRAAKWAPLHATVASGDRQAVEDLLDKGADVNAKGEGGVALHVAALKGHKDIAELLITRGADVDAKANWGHTPLHIAAREGHKAVAELLITRGADVDAKAKFNTWGLGGWTPLYFAIRYHHSDVAELLLAKGADVNVKDEHNMMPLHLALYIGPTDLAELLVARDADVNAKGGTRGIAPLHIAAGEGHKAVAELLISKGVDVNAKTRDGKTPMSLAKEERHNEIIELLRKHGVKE
ncbi:MAG: ankyrin repeat domain-containing protein [Planctomycetota bacterium]|jgi:ankyrin repeat protein/beta-lactamase regulating signal transducer with metallopeptidase domain